MQAVRSNTDLQDDELLGYLVFQTIDENVRIHKTDLADIFRDVGLSSSYLPDEIRAPDAFRRATATIKYNNLDIYLPEYGQTYKGRVFVEEVHNGPEQIIRFLTREIIDYSLLDTHYANVAHLIFDRKTSSFSYSLRSGVLSEYRYIDLIHEAQRLYQDYLEYHNKDTIVNLSRRIVRSMNPITIQPRSRATFIPKYSRYTLKSYQEMIHRLPGDSVVDIIPLIDTVEQRDLVRKRAEISLKEEVGELITSLTDLLMKKESLSVKQMKSYASRFVELQDRVKQYQKLLSCSMTTLKDQFQQAMTLLDSLDPSETAIDDGQESLAL